MTNVDTREEQKRVEALHSYEILDTKEEKEFDNLVKLAAQVCDVPFAKLNFLDGVRSWSKANFGNDVKETPQEAAFCHYTIQDETYMVVEDTLKDDRFRNFAFVVESPNVRFYAGFNIKGKGQNIGTICVLGQEPKQLSDAQLESLAIIANEVESRLELKKKNKDLATLTAFLEASVEAMLIVNPETQKIEHKNSNGNELLSKLISENDDRPLNELFPGWNYLDELKKWHEAGGKHPVKMETSLENIEGEEVFLEVNTTQKYGKWLITFQNITQRKLTEKDLKQEKKLSDTIINALPSHFYMFDEEMNFIRWNKNIVETTGRTEEELVDLSPADFFEGEDIQRVSEYVRRTMNGFEGSIQADLVMKDGSKEPYLYHAIAFENSGKKYFLGTGQSVAEHVEYQSSLKNLINEKEVLLQEVHHRVKNNLAVISGFLQLQELISEDEGTKSVLLSNYMRVKSMAMIHEELYKAKDFTGIDFEHYLKEVLTVLTDKLSPNEKDIKLNISSESIYMNLNQAVPLALIVNELVSNAYTFAFDGRDEGNVWVRLKLKEDEIYLSVEDDGIGLPEDFKFEESPTLGTTLVMSYSEQINADVKISSEKGTHYELRFSNNTSKSGSNLHTEV
jgi:PAS domain S-box-containing protein